MSLEAIYETRKFKYECHTQSHPNCLSLIKKNLSVFRLLEQVLILNLTTDSKEEEKNSKKRKTIDSLSSKQKSSTINNRKRYKSSVKLSQT